MQLQSARFSLKLKRYLKCRQNVIKPTQISQMSQVLARLIPRISCLRVGVAGIRCGCGFCYDNAGALAPPNMQHVQLIIKFGIMNDLYKDSIKFESWSNLETTNWVRWNLNPVVISKFHSPRYYRKLPSTLLISKFLSVSESYPGWLTDWILFRACQNT